MLKLPGLVVYGRIFSCKLQKPTLLHLSRKDIESLLESLGYLENVLQGGYHCSLPWVYHIDTTAAAAPSSVEVAFTARDSSSWTLFLVSATDSKNSVVCLPPVESGS